MKIVSGLLLTLASVIVLSATDQYFFCPVYSFKNTSRFSGDSIYNPYATQVAGEWVKCNFHAHSLCWEGITNGVGTPKDIYRIYTKLNYGVHTISNYQNIDTSFNKLSGYITAYEHGYNMRKNHQLVLGADKICWKDYLLPQTINNKQEILNYLSSDTSALIIINHPLVRKAYCAFDFQHLTNYSCVEVLSPSCISSALWDAALSVGKPVFLVGDDDIHNVFDSSRVGRICTWVNVPAVDKANVIRALKTGCSYGMIIGKGLMQQELEGNNIRMPMLHSNEINGKTITVKFSLPAKEIIVSGENGQVLHKMYDTDSISYDLATQQPYARVVALYLDGTQLFLNPVFRYKKHPLYEITASINRAQTFLFRFLGIIVELIWLLIIIKLSGHSKILKRARHKYQELSVPDNPFKNLQHYI